MINMTTFLELLIKFENNKTLPNVSFKHNTSLYPATLKLIGNNQVFSSMYNTKMILEELIEEFSKKQITSVESFELFDNLSKVFVDKLSAAINSIDGIKETVIHLSKDINDRINVILTKDPFASVHLNKTELNETFEEIQWDKYNVMGTDEIIINVMHEGLNIRTSSEANNSAFELGLRKLAVNEIPFKSIDLPKEKYDECIDILNNAITELPIEEVRDVFKIITNEVRANRFKYNVLQYGKTPYDIKTILFYLNRIDELHKVYKTIRQNQDKLDFSNTTLEVINYNFNILANYMAVMAYGIIYSRRVVLKDALVLQEQLINPDNITEFKAKNGNNLMIAHHLNYLFKDGIIPNRGITVDAIISMNDNIKKQVSANNRNIDLRLKVIKNAAIKSSFISIVDKYFKETIQTGTQSNMTLPNEFIQNMGGLLVTQNMVLEDVLYDTIINLFYKHTLVDIIYNKLGIEYIKLLSIKSAIDSKDLLISETHVFTELMCDFLFKFVDIE